MDGFPNITQPFIGPGGFVQQVWLKLLQTLWNRSGAAQGGGIVPTGTIADYAGKTPPTGWIVCDGSEVARNVYVALFNAIGTTWGIGDGKTTFNLPNLTGKFRQGGASVGTTGGAASVTISTAQLPAHNHGITDPGHTHTVTDPGHVHASVVAASTNTAGAAAGATTSGNTSSAVTGITNQTATTGITTNNAGAGNPVPILPPYVVVLTMIKT